MPLKLASNIFHSTAQRSFISLCTAMPDLDYPDRSALIFAPDPSGTEDGLLQVREIRGLRLKAKLVTLSACNTGVGPVGEAGVANLGQCFHRSRR